MKDDEERARRFAAQVHIESYLTESEQGQAVTRELADLLAEAFAALGTSVGPSEDAEYPDPDGVLTRGVARLGERSFGIAQAALQGALADAIYDMVYGEVRPGRRIEA